MTGPNPQERPTPAQIAANRTNAQRSTGPRTQQGKARSRQNALRHGVYASVEIAVQQGPFAEDPDEVQDLLTQLVDALAPRDIHEECRARRIAMLQLQERRLDAYEATLLQQAETADTICREQRADVVEEGIRDFIVDWNEARCADAHSRSKTPQEASLPWELMAIWLRTALDDDVRISGLWDSQREPKGHDEWRRAFETVALRRFPTARSMAAFLRDCRDRAEANTLARDDRRRRRVATASLDTFDDCNRKRSRITNELMKQWVMYTLLQERQLPVQE
jgi:hypothetical protein